MIPDKAFILAAGFGTRMRPLTDTRPKPLVEISGKPLLTHICDRLKSVGVKTLVVNTHYLPEKINAWAQTQTDMDVIISHEDPVLDTGGGIKNALHYFNDDPFFVIAGDSFWVNNDICVLTQLSDMWRNDMDILVALKGINHMTLTRGVGDYNIDETNHAMRSLDKTGTHMFTNIRINHPRIYRNKQDGAFSFLECLDEAETRGTLYAYDMTSDWYHISTPDDLNRVEDHIES